MISNILKQCALSNNKIPLPISPKEQIQSIFYNVKCFEFTKIVLTTHRIILLKDSDAFFIPLKRILSIRNNCCIRMIAEDGILHNIIVGGDCEIFIDELKKTLSKVTCELIEINEEDDILYCDIIND